MTAFTQEIMALCPAGHLWQDWETGDSAFNIFYDREGWASAEPLDYEDGCDNQQDYDYEYAYYGWYVS